MADLISTGPRRREEAFNTRLADRLSLLGVDAEAEVIAKQGVSHKLPDIQLRWFGVPMVLECKFDDTPEDRRAVEAQARERLEQSFGALAIAVLYPASLRSAANVVASLEEVTLLIKLFAPGQESQKWMPVHGIGGLASAIDGARGQLAAEDAVQRAVEWLGAAVDIFARAASHQEGRVPHLLALITVADAAAAGKRDKKAQAAAVRICGLAVCTATLLQAELSRFDPLIPPLPSSSPDSLRQDMVRSWEKILQQDYASVFRLATDVLKSLDDGDAALGQALVNVVQMARRVTATHILGRHDLVGRIYHRLLADAKYLATYFTSVPAATLLCNLVLEPNAWPDIDWTAEPEEFSLRIGDLACGTGTLLAAAMSVVRQSWASRRAQAGKSVELENLAKRLVEDNLWGMDILAYAVQVCAGTLLLSSGRAVVRRTRLYQMPFGGTEGRIGSLELLMGSTQAALFGDPDQLEITLDQKSAATVPLAGPPELDLVIMNPPFTRSVHSSRLLGSLEGLDFTQARKRLAELCKRSDVAADLNAGLAAPFVELASRSVRPGGRLALVLPKSVLTGPVLPSVSPAAK